MMDATVYYGEVIFFRVKPGYGFISWKKDGQEMKDMFVHYSDIDMQGFRQLTKGQKVEFSLGTNKRGEPKALNVKIVQ